MDIKLLTGEDRLGNLYKVKYAPIDNDSGETEVYILAGNIEEVINAIPSVIFPGILPGVISEKDELPEDTIEYCKSRIKEITHIDSLVLSTRDLIH